MIGPLENIILTFFFFRFILFFFLVFIFEPNKITVEAIAGFLHVGLLLF